MTRARDKASSVVANFASTGIDDNADATAITIDSSGHVLVAQIWFPVRFKPQFTFTFLLAVAGLGWVFEFRFMTLLL